MSDEAETVRDAVGSLWAWTSGQGGKYPDIEHDRAIAAIATLESQNQALQREVENKAAILNAIEALLDVDDEHTGWDRIVALQERAEKAEAYLLVIADGTWNEAHVREVEGRADNIHVEQFARSALSPTQEIDR